MQSSSPVTYGIVIGSLPSLTWQISFVSGPVADNLTPNGWTATLASIDTSNPDAVWAVIDVTGPDSANGGWDVEFWTASGGTNYHLQGGFHYPTIVLLPGSGFTIAVTQTPPTGAPVAAPLTWIMRPNRTISPSPLPDNSSLPLGTYSGHNTETDMWGNVYHFGDNPNIAVTESVVVELANNQNITSSSIDIVAPTTTTFNLASYLESGYLVSLKKGDGSLADYSSTIVLGYEPIKYSGTSAIEWTVKDSVGNVIIVQTVSVWTRDFIPDDYTLVLKLTDDYGTEVDESGAFSILQFSCVMAELTGRIFGVYGHTDSGIYNLHVTANDDGIWHPLGIVDVPASPNSIFQTSDGRIYLPAAVSSNGGASFITMRAPWLSPYGSFTINVAIDNSAISAAYKFGTEEVWFKRDDLDWSHALSGVEVTTATGYKNLVRCFCLPDSTIVVSDGMRFLWISRDGGKTFTSAATVLWNVNQYVNGCLLPLRTGGYASSAMKRVVDPPEAWHRYSPDGVDWSAAPVKIGEFPRDGGFVHLIELPDSRRIGTNGKDTAFVSSDNGAIWGAF